MRVFRGTSVCVTRAKRRCNTVPLLFSAAGCSGAGGVAGGFGVSESAAGAGSADSTAGAVQNAKCHIRPAKIMLASTSVTDIYNQHIQRVGKI